MGLPGKTAGTGQDSQDMRLEGFFKRAPILYIKIQFFLSTPLKQFLEIIFGSWLNLGKP
jgi:hypothetical protein